jgi:putative NADH-flavin reductase
MVQGALTDVNEIRAAMHGQDAVLCALGLRPTFAHVVKRNTILSDATRLILAEMRRAGVRRLICQTTLGLGDSRGMGGFVYSAVELPVFLGRMYADKADQEDAVIASDCDWTILRPAALMDGPMTGAYALCTSASARGLTWKVSRADVAHAMLGALAGDDLRKQIACSHTETPESSEITSESRTCTFKSDVRS